jgi:Spy/CpxP family protein refolding chaperone
MKKGILILVAAVLLLPLAALAQPAQGDEPLCPQGRGMGQGPGHFCHGPMGAGHRGIRGDDEPGIGYLLQVADEIGLTEQQREQLKKMQLEFRTQQIDREAELEKAEVQLRALMTDKNAAEAEVLRKIDDVSRLKGEMQKMRYTHRKQMRGVLTDEQVEKLQQMRKDRWEQGHGMGMKSGTRGGRMGRHGAWGRP